jgi:hypothetical protein
MNTMFAHLHTPHPARLRHALLAAYRRGLPDTRDTEFGLGPVIRPGRHQHLDAVRASTSRAA